MRTRFVAGKAGTLRFIPPGVAALGAAVSPTVTIRQADGRDLPTPVIDAVASTPGASTTLGAAAAVGDRQVTLASSLGVFVGPHLLTSASGESELVEIAGISAAKVAILVDPLHRAFDVGDVVSVVEFAYDLAAEQLVNPTERAGHLYRAAWSYVAGSATHHADQLFEVRARLLTPTLTEAEVSRYLPARLDELMDGGPRALRAILGEAWDDVLDDAASRGFEPDKIMDCDRLRRPHRAKTLAILASSWGPNWKDWAATKATEYAHDLDAALNAGDWYDSSGDLLQAQSETKVTSVRLTR